MQKWLSFIVPVYNAEKYLAECIDSMLNQDFPLEQYEIILVNDGSTDNSLCIAKEYAGKYDNIHLFTHPNSGVSYTRNEGLRRAKGEYVWFVDSDDCVAENILPVLFEQTREFNLDMLIFNYVRFRGTHYWKYKAFYFKDSPLDTGIKLFEDFYYEVAMWNRLVSRAFLLANNLQFVIARFSEDSELSVRCFYHAKRVKAIAVDAIYYRVVDGSLSHNEMNWTAIVESSLECLDNHYNYMITHPCDVFWMRAFVLDLRRIHIAIDKLTSSDERKAFCKKEKAIVGKIIHHLPIYLNFDFVILALCAISPMLILKIQYLLRKVKHLK
ncbi:glycosyltransferase [uncultured Bacteroides sp.]|uniref:glycosyltransferase family 2 protein n=1 Tax=uncultured Bacteroides sp. TaxID=162156 RepID=UPI0025E558A5|nr:glycosyltransferase [uncultured Bacteroides sp.]